VGRSFYAVVGLLYLPIALTVAGVALFYLGHHTASYACLFAGIALRLLTMLGAKIWARRSDRHFANPS
jgi:hypothetical protein